MATGIMKWLSALVFLLMGQMLTALPLQRRGLIPSLSSGPVVMGSGTYPRSNKLSDGSLIGVYTQFAGGYSGLEVVRSTDGGNTWVQIGEVTRGLSASHDIDNPYILQLPSGRLLTAFRNHDLNNGAYTYFRITICYSDNNGASWTFLNSPASDPGPVNGNWEPFLRNAEDGSLQLYYARENNANDQDILMRTSTDGGNTWSGTYCVVGGNLASTRDGMFGAATVNGPNLIGVFEQETNGGQFTIGAVTSSDDGRTWGNSRTIFVPSAGNANAPQVVNVGGTMVTSVQTDEDSPGNVAAKVITSGDGGNTWGNKITFSPAISHWPGLVTLDNNDLLGLADDAGAKSQRITLN